MSQASADQMEPDDRDRAILRTLAEGRANPYHLRQQTDVTDKNDMHDRLAELGSYGYVRKVTRGLYEITDMGRAEVGTTVEDEPMSIEDRVTQATRQDDEQD